MKKTKYTEEQIAYAFKQAETGTPIADVIRRMGISEQTFDRLKKLYGGLGVGGLRRLKQLEDENRNLKQWVADLSLDKHILQDVLSKSPDAWTQARDGRAGPGGSWLERTTVLRGARRRLLVDRYRSIRRDQTPMRLRIRDLWQTRVRYGFFRIYILLRREGWHVNHKRVYRLYREDGLSLCL